MQVPEPAPAARPVRLAIVDSDHRVRDSLAALVGSGDEIEVVGAAGHVSEAIELVAARAPDVVILDPRLPEVESGLGLISELRRRWPALRVLVMSWADGLEGACLEVGADCFIRKSGGPNDLVDAIIAYGRPDRLPPSAPARADSLPATLARHSSMGGSA